METIYFNRAVNSKKPSTIRNSKTTCPFCDTSQLAAVVDSQDDMILVQNKFSTLKDANMMVLIESNVCDSNVHTYTIEKLTELLKFAIEKWISFEQTGEYKSVALFKNKGLHSSGTIKHPHMQIIGFKDQDCHKQIKFENLEGHSINIGGDIEFNLSTLPKISFLEYNVEVTTDYPKLAKTLSLITKYIEETYWGPEASYNFFFYNIEGKRYLKITPRYPTSAIHIGYGLVQIYDEQLLNDYECSIRDFYNKLSE